MSYPKRTKFHRYQRVRCQGRFRRLNHMSRFSNMSPTNGRMSSNRNIRDHQRRMLAAGYELERMPYKAICRDITLPSRARNRTMVKWYRLPRNSSFTRVRNRCIFTGRSRSVYKSFRIPRIVSRELASKGYSIGINKACW